VTSPAASLYLDLLGRTLTGMVYEDPPSPGQHWISHDEYREPTRHAGLDWPQRAPCMIGLERLGNVRDCVQQALADGVPGDLAECGAWRGGTTIWMRALLKLAGVTDRSVWVIDSFAGLPAETMTSEDWGAPLMAYLAVPLEEVKHNFSLYGMLDDQVKFLPGWFADTLPDAPVGRLAVLRLDGDLYESQLAVLTHLYPRLSPGGYVIIDDSHLGGCARAVREYRESHQVTDPVQEAGKYAIWWRKER
jgi:Macrocin-O-methyltransferase (TylF)